MDRSDAARSRERNDGRSWFETLVERTQQFVSRAPFFFVCVCIIIAWAISLPLFSDAKTWMAVIHTVSSVLSLLLFGPPGELRSTCRGSGAGETQRPG